MEEQGEGRQVILAAPLHDGGEGAFADAVPTVSFPGAFGLRLKLRHERSLVATILEEVLCVGGGKPYRLPIIAKPAPSVRR